jgi:hypothetical protein
MKWRPYDLQPDKIGQSISVWPTLKQKGEERLHF